MKFFRQPQNSELRLISIADSFNSAGPSQTKQTHYCDSDKTTRRTGICASHHDNTILSLLRRGHPTIQLNILLWDSITKYRQKRCTPLSYCPSERLASQTIGQFPDHHRLLLLHKGVSEPDQYCSKQPTFSLVKILSPDCLCATAQTLPWSTKIHGNLHPR
jgi:hypothetical protein